MAKKSANKRSSETLKTRPTAQARTHANPFEVRINKVKQNVIGRKASKSESGRPNKSRYEGYKKRKQTLLGEYRKKDKKTEFLDNRIRDEEGGFAARKAKVWQMRNKLADEDLALTHRGRQLTNEVINERLIESDEEDMNLLERDDYVYSAHFGGGGEGPARSQAEFMSEILEEKRRRQLEKEADLDLTEKLDENWLEVRNLLKHKNDRRGMGHDQGDSEQKDSYDLLVRELGFASSDKPTRSTPTISTALSQRTETGQEQHKGRPFADKLALTLETEDGKRLERIIESFFSEISNLTPKNMKNLHESLANIDPDTFDLQSFALLVYAACIRDLRQKMQFKIIEAINSIKLITLTDKWKSLILCELLHLVSEDKFMPEIIRTLQNMLALCINHDTGLKLDKFYVPQADLYKVKYDRLNIDRYDKNEGRASLAEAFNDQSPPSPAILFERLLQLIGKVAQAYKKYPAFSEAMLVIQSSLEQLQDSAGANQSLANRIGRLRSDLTVNIQQSDKSSIAPKKQVFMLPMIEPLLEGGRLDRRSADPKKKLQKKVKREYKGAQRELRKDSAFIRETWAKEAQTRDAARKKKVNTLMNDLAAQQGMFKKSRR